VPARGVGAADRAHPRHGHRISLAPLRGRRHPGWGVGAMLCFQLFVEGDNLGALNLYAATPGAFTGAQQEHQLSTALASRDIIGQAKGIVMER